jgi:membrane fusion protein, multidrug efflux system
MTRLCIASAAVITLACTVACRNKPVEEIETSAAVPVKTITLAPSTVEGVISATGVVTPAPGSDWTITAPEAARIVEMPKAEGDRVRKGDLLVRFEIPTLTADVTARRAEVAQAQARVENAEAALNRLKTLVEHGVAAQKELEDARREDAEARAALAQAQGATQSAAVLQSRSVVRAQFDGIVAKRSHNPGDIVEAASADVILRVIDPAHLQVVSAVAIADLRRIEVGRPVRILVPGAEDAEPGRILTRPASVEPGGVTADVRVAFDGPTRLPAGTPVRVEITAEVHNNVLAVPAEAILHEEGDAFVMVAGTDGKAHRRKIETGLTTPKLVEVKGGLKPGDAVIVQGHQELPDGGVITVSQ